MRELLKAGARALATVIVSPALASYAVRSLWLGKDRALEGSTQALAWLPGVLGQYLRRAFLQRALAYCDASATVEFGTIFSQSGARLEAQSYVGPRCHLGLVHLGPDTLLAAGVHVPSGGATHAIEDVAVAIRDQPHQRTMVRIGEGSWVGSNAVVLADVGRHAVVGAGAVVTRPVPDYAVAVGVPARVVRDRRAQAASAP